MQMRLCDSAKEPKQMESKAGTKDSGRLSPEIGKNGPGLAEVCKDMLGPEVARSSGSNKSPNLQRP